MRVRTLLSVPVLWCGAVFGQASPPNVLMIIADDLGWNDVSWHNPAVIMPNLDRLAREGLILENNYVQPTCGPSRTALLTGYYPIHTGMQFLPLADTEPIGLPTKFKLLPQYLKDIGYSTHLAGKWHLGYCSPEYQPSSRGFDEYKGFWLGGGDHFQHGALAFIGDEDPIPGFDFHNGENPNPAAMGTDTSAIIADAFSSLLSERAGLRKHWRKGFSEGDITMSSYNASNPFYFQAAFQDVHAPLQIQEEYEAMYPDEEDLARRMLLGMASRLDASVGKMIKDLERFTYRSTGGEIRNLMDDTVIIFTSDNGGMSQGIGYQGGSNTPLSGRKGDTLEGGCRVPGFVYNSGRSGVTDQLVHITDWLPTIYSGLAGGDASKLPEDLDGINQIELLSQQEGMSPRDEILYDIANFEETNHTFFVPQPQFPANFVLDGAFGGALRYQGFKIILGCSTLIGCSSSYNETYGGSQSNDRVLLYNLVADPGETTDLSTDPQYMDILEELRVRLMLYVEGSAPPLHAPNSPDGLPKLGQFVSGWCEPIEDPYSPIFTRSQNLSVSFKDKLNGIKTLVQTKIESLLG